MNIPKRLQPGYLGELSLEDAQEIAAELMESAELRRLWGIKKRLNYPLALIGRLSMPEDPDEGERLMMQKLSADRKRKKRE